MRFGEIAVADRIDINGLVVTTIVGALPHERESPSRCSIDLSLQVDLRDAGRSDELGDTAQLRRRHPTGGRRRA